MDNNTPDPARHNGLAHASNAEMGEHLPGDQSLGTSFEDDRSTPPKTGRSHRAPHAPISTADKNGFTNASVASGLDAYLMSGDR